MKKTALYNQHIKENAKLVSFAGYYMPISYGKISDEYNAVRHNCGIFDVSHMGQIQVTGNDAASFLNYLTINNVDKISDYEAQYSAMCDHDGNLIDDLIVFKFSNTNYIIIVNASNKIKVLDWMKSFDDYAVDLDDLNITNSLIALQGPKSREILNKISHKAIEIPFYHIKKIQLLNHEIILSRTGYTGELGYEILGSHSAINDLWDYFLNHNVKATGLAVRDVLRLEMKYCLYGNDINSDINPIEAGLSWIVDLNKDNFCGKQQLLNIKKNESKAGRAVDKKLFGFKMIDKAIPRKGYSIYVDDYHVGEVTSGTHSPGLSYGIGLGYIKSNYNQIGRKINIEIRGKLIEAEIVKTPFLKNTSLHH